jgi:tetratricopeptide (TPR) repeat protein
LTSEKRDRVSPVSQSGEACASREKQKVILSLLLVVVILAFYNPVAHNGFVFFDDSPYIVKNPPIQNGITWQTVKWAFTTFHAGNWHPLTWLSHALDCQIFGLNPAGHHYVSLMLHAVNAVLVFLVLESATGLAWPSLLVAALFALHPLNVESVAWAAERKNVLSMFFCLLALSSYTRYARSGRTSTYIWVLLFFALGLMAKPQVIPLPFVLLLWDYWPLGRLRSDPAAATSGQSERCRPPSLLLFEKIPLFVLAALSAAITMVAQRSRSSVRSLEEFSLPARIESGVVSHIRYLGDTFWPAKLAPMYPHPGNSLPAWQVLSSAFVLFLVTLIVIRWRDRRYLMTGWLWFLGSLIPMIGLVQVGEQAMADRYMYLPLIGILIAVVWTAWELAANDVSRQWLAVPAIVVPLALGIVTHRQLGHWHDGETLWRYTLSVTQGNYMAHDNLAMVLAEQGRVDEAIAEFRAAEALHAYPAAQILSLGAYEQRNGHVDGAIEQYGKALQSTSDPAVQAAAYDQMASAYSQRKDWDRARQAYEKALSFRPTDPAALVGSGLLAQRSGDGAQAVTQLSRAIKIAPSDVGLLLLAGALRQSGRNTEAEAAYAESQKISPDFAETRKAASQIASSFGVMFY